MRRSAGCFPMSRRRLGQMCFVPLLTAAIAIAVIRGASGQAENDALMAGRGKVSFVVSCDANLQPRFDAALAALHSFWYGQALNEFTSITEADQAVILQIGNETNWILYHIFAAIAEVVLITLGILSHWHKLQCCGFPFPPPPISTRATKGDRRGIGVNFSMRYTQQPVPPRPRDRTRLAGWLILESSWKI